MTTTAIEDFDTLCKICGGTAGRPKQRYNRTLKMVERCVARVHDGFTLPFEQGFVHRAVHALGKRRC